MAADDDRSKHARADLGYTKPFTVKMHPDLHARMRALGERRYMSDQECVRQAVLAWVEAGER